MKTILYGLTSLLFIGIIIASIATYLISAELHKDGAFNQDKLFSIEKGSSVALIAKNLQKNDLISKDWLFIVGSRAIKADKKIKTGEYSIPAKSSILDIIDILVLGKQHQYSLTIPEGLNSYQVIELINSNPILTGEITDFPKDGSLLPETYYFTKNTSKTEIITRMQKNMQEILKAEWAKRDKNLPLKTMQEALILASIVEKETGINSERAKVAGVFINRLNKGMKLQTDPTVIYAITDGGKKPLKRKLYFKDLEKPHPYNTYSITGLPPAPICHPSYKSIVASLHPETHKYIYFVANGTGGHNFAKTLNGHNKNVAAWRRVRK